jgi:hypothetical protein
MPFDRKKFGLQPMMPDHRSNASEPAVAPLGPPPKKVAQAIDETDAENLRRAWHAYDVTMLNSDGDAQLADKAWEAVRRERRRSSAK